ncbi:hypothetical protein [Streptomyces sp. NPDC048720]|uniref:hypothetical protein n=1 Tax=Streptomyces sp. NPDC048720 TaxID=3365588 RepID=UPI00371765C9
MLLVARFLPALAAVLAAKPLGAELITGMSRYAERQKLTRCCYEASDLVEERGAEGIIKIEELIGGLGADSVVEAVGTQEVVQAVGATCGGRPTGLRERQSQCTWAPARSWTPLPSEQATEGYKAMDERRAPKVLLTL